MANRPSPIVTITSRPTDDLSKELMCGKPIGTAKRKLLSHLSAIIVCFSLDLNPRRSWLLCRLFLAET